MPDPAVDKPIVVPESGLPTIAVTILRYVLTAIGGWLVTKGWFSDETVNHIVGALLVLIPTAYGAWLSKRNHAQKVVMAEKLPDKTAVVTPS